MSPSRRHGSAQMGRRASWWYASLGVLGPLTDFIRCTPALLDTLRVTMGWAWTYLVVAELVASNAGLGYAILKAQRFLQTDKIFVGILLIGAIGLVTDQRFRWAHRHAFSWLYLRG